MTLAFSTEPTLTGAAQIGADLVAVAGVIGGGTSPYIQTGFSIEQSVDGSAWTQRSTVSPIAVIKADAGLRFRFVNSFTDSAGTPETISFTTSALGPVSADIPFFDCSLGGSKSTSYICLEEAELILQTNLQSSGLSGWSKLSDNDKKRSLNLASSVITPLDWKGEKCSCEQSLAWPRVVSDCTCQLATCTTIPFHVKSATSYLAASLAAGNTNIGSIGGGGGSGTNSGSGASSGSSGGVEALEPFSSVTLGPINVQLKEKEETAASSEWGWEILPAYVQSMLSDWIKNSAGISGIGQALVTRQSIAKAHSRLPWQVPGKYALHDGKVFPRYSRGWGK